MYVSQKTWSDRTLYLKLFSRFFFLRIFDYFSSYVLKSKKFQLILAERSEISNRRYRMGKTTIQTKSELISRNVYQSLEYRYAFKPSNKFKKIRAKYKVHNLLRLVADSRYFLFSSFWFLFSTLGTWCIPWSAIITFL